MAETPAYITAETATDWRAWLDANHQTEPEVWLMYWKKGSGKPSIAWADAVEVALSFGWIDGLIRSLDEHRYLQRWTPRSRRPSRAENGSAHTPCSARCPRRRI